MLCVGCGSLVLTNQVYSQCTNSPIVLLYRSLGMLVKGNHRLLNDLGDIPDNIIFVQRDVRDLPFKDDSFGTALSFGM